MYWCMCTCPYMGYVSYLSDEEFTRNGNGVGQGLAGPLLTELRVLDTVLWGHSGGFSTSCSLSALFVQQRFDFTLDTKKSAKLS